MLRQPFPSALGRRCRPSPQVFNNPLLNERHTINMFPNDVRQLSAHAGPKD